jgi:hypothetical protein
LSPFHRSVMTCTNDVAHIYYDYDTFWAHFLWVEWTILDLGPIIRARACPLYQQASRCQVLDGRWQVFCTKRPACMTEQKPLEIFWCQVNVPWKSKMN